MIPIPAYLIGGVLAIGKLLNNNKQSRTIQYKDDKLLETMNETDRSADPNLLENSYYNKSHQIETEHVSANFEKSFDPVNTNIIPMFYNTLGSSSTITYTKNPNYDPNVIKNIINDPSFVKDTIPDFKNGSPNANDLTIIGDGTYEVGEQILAPIGFNGNKDLGTEEYIQERPMSSNDVNNRDVPIAPNEFIHNNMVPFFAKSTQNMNVDNRSYSGKLEQFTGQMELDKTQKTEVGSFFAPVEQNPVSATINRDYDRYITSLTIRNNELPFEQQKVGHGLNNGYTAKPTGGFHPTLRIMPKVSGDLYINPRCENDGRVIRGKDRVDKRTAQQQMYKYKPELLVTNFNGERNFTTTGERLKEKARYDNAIKSEIYIHPTERIRSKPIMGHANRQTGSVRSPTKMLPKSRISGKVTYKMPNYRNVVRAEGKRGQKNKKATFENKLNERAISGEKYGKCGYAFTNLKSEVDKNQQYFYDQAKNTKLQPYVHNPNPAGYCESYVPKNQVYDPVSYQPETTLRELTENNSHSGYVNSELKKNPVVDNVNWQARTTTKETTENDDHIGNVTQLLGGSKHQTYDPINWNAKTTIRETTENNDHITSVDAGYMQNGNGYQIANMEDINTNRQFYTDYKYLKGATPAGAPSKTRKYDAEYNMRQNTNMEVIAKGRVPTISNVKVTNQDMNIQIKKIDSDEINQYAFSKNPTNPKSYLPVESIEITSVKNNLPPYDNRLDNKLLKAFNQNPLTQSLHSYA